MKILFLSPHTDDIELGCGGTISRLIRENNDVYAVIFSTCSESLPKGYPKDTLKIECLSSLGNLGLKSEKIIFFDYKVRNFPEIRQCILENLVKIKEEINPDMIFIPSIDDYHQDHKTIAEESIRCFKNNCSIISYELIWNNTGFKNQLYYVLKEEDVQNKINSLSFYKSQSNRKYMSGDFILSLAKVRGIQNGIDFAEAFEVIRLKV
jgi:LmbE family N-acetylglucosaminyl deacetylase